MQQTATNCNPVERRLRGRRFNLIAHCSILTALLALPTVADVVGKPIADGVYLTQDINADAKSPLVTNILRIDLKKPGVRLSTALAGDTIIEADVTKGRERVSTLVGRKNAVAGVNGDFFPFTGDPLGLAIAGGELVSEPMNRAAIGITPTGAVLADRLSYSGTITSAAGLPYPLGGLNRERGKNEILLYAPIFGVTTGEKVGVEVPLSLTGPIRQNTDIAATVTADPAPAANAPIPKGGAVLSAEGPASLWLSQNLHNGDKIKLRFDIRADSGRDWSAVTEAMGGGPWLVKAGEVFVDATEEKFQPAFLIRHPRTAVGVTKLGELLLVTVDGRQDISQGMTLTELGGLMKNLGAVDAINLDGGGSTSMSIWGAVTNSPSEGIERPVADMLLVYANQAATAGPELKFVDASPLVVASGEPHLLSTVGTSADAPTPNASDIVWGTTGGIGFVNQKGYFIPKRPGKGSVVAFYGGSKFELPICVVSGQPANLTAELSKQASDASNVSQVTATVTDKNGNGVSGIEVSMTVKGGTSSAATELTDTKGQASFTITWNTDSSAGEATVTAGGLTATAK